MTQRSPLVRFAARCDPIFALSRPGAAQRLAIVPRLAHEFNAKADKLDFRPGTPDGLDGGTNRPSHTLGRGTLEVGEPCAS
jgi:hypothetical protein